jgi:hypothetical protein
VTTNFLGIPIEGDITRGYEENQRPIEEFSPILQAVLNDSSIIEFGWRQYTPYFNDGDPCVFSANTTWVRTDADIDEEDIYDLEVMSYHPTLTSDRDRYERCIALSRAVESGEFYNVLLDAFGDHAEVTVTSSGIKVDFYEHE